MLIVYMNGITKTMTLDACVDGNVSNLSQLVGDEYDQFSKFFQIYKQLPVSSYAIVYVASKEFASFHVDCEVMSVEEINTLKETYGGNGVIIEPRDKGISVNIPIR